MAAATELELQQDIPISGTGQQRLEELIAKRKGKVTSINPKIENINKRPKGLGDFIEKITIFTGIKWIVDKIAGGKCSACEKR